MIKRENFGKHEDVLFAHFGSGDITFIKSMEDDSGKCCSLIFMNHEKRKIGEVSNDFVGLSSDDIPKPEFVFTFTKPESIAALIHSLIEIQKDLFELNKQGK